MSRKSFIKLNETVNTASKGRRSFVSFREEKRNDFSVESKDGNHRISIDTSDENEKVSPKPKSHSYAVHGTEQDNSMNTASIDERATNKRNIDLLQTESLQPAIINDNTLMRFKVLVADAYGITRQIIKKAIKQSFSEDITEIIIQETDDMLESIELFTDLSTISHSFDCVFIGYTLSAGTGSGLELIKYLRERLYYKKLIIGICYDTPSSKDDGSEEFRFAGADVVVSRPLSLESIRLTIQHKLSVIKQRKFSLHPPSRRPSSIQRHSISVDVVEKTGLDRALELFAPGAGGGESSNKNDKQVDHIILSGKGILQDNNNDISDKLEKEDIIEQIPAGTFKSMTRDPFPTTFAQIYQFCLKLTDTTQTLFDKYRHNFDLIATNSTPPKRKNSITKLINAVTLSKLNTPTGTTKILTESLYLNAIFKQSKLLNKIILEQESRNEDVDRKALPNQHNETNKGNNNNKLLALNIPKSLTIPADVMTPSPLKSSTNSNNNTPLPSVRNNNNNNNIHNNINNDDDFPINSSRIALLNESSTNQAQGVDGIELRTSSIVTDQQQQPVTDSLGQQSSNNDSSPGLFQVLPDAREKLKDSDDTPVRLPSGSRQRTTESFKSTPNSSRHSTPDSDSDSATRRRKSQSPNTRARVNLNSADKDKNKRSDSANKKDRSVDTPPSLEGVSDLKQKMIERINSARNTKSNQSQSRGSSSSPSARNQHMVKSFHMPSESPTAVTAAVAAAAAAVKQTEAAASTSKNLNTEFEKNSSLFHHMQRLSLLEKLTEKKNKISHRKPLPVNINPLVLPLPSPRSDATSTHPMNSSSSSAMTFSNKIKRNNDQMKHLYMLNNMFSVNSINQYYQNLLAAGYFAELKESSENDDNDDDDDLWGDNDELGDVVVPTEYSYIVNGQIKPFASSSNSAKFSTVSSSKSFGQPSSAAHALSDRRPSFHSHDHVSLDDSVTLDELSATSSITSKPRDSSHLNSNLNVDHINKYTNFMPSGSSASRTSPSNKAYNNYNSSNNITPVQNNIETDYSDELVDVQPEQPEPRLMDMLKTNNPKMKFQDAQSTQISGSTKQRDQYKSLKEIIETELPPEKKTDKKGLTDKLNDNKKDHKRSLEPSTPTDRSTVLLGSKSTKSVVSLNNKDSINGLGSGADDIFMPLPNFFNDLLLEFFPDHEIGQISTNLSLVSSSHETAAKPKMEFEMELPQDLKLKTKLAKSSLTSTSPTSTDSMPPTEVTKAVSKPDLYIMTDDIDGMSSAATTPTLASFNIDSLTPNSNIDCMTPKSNFSLLSPCAAMDDNDADDPLPYENSTSTTDSKVLVKSTDVTSTASSTSFVPLDKEECKLLAAGVKYAISEHMIVRRGFNHPVLTKEETHRVLTKTAKNRIPLQAIQKTNIVVYDEHESENYATSVDPTAVMNEFNPNISLVVSTKSIQKPMSNLGDIGSLNDSYSFTSNTALPQLGVTGRSTHSKGSKSNGQNSQKQNESYDLGDDDDSNDDINDDKSHHTLDNHITQENAIKAQIDNEAVAKTKEVKKKSVLPNDDPIALFYLNKEKFKNGKFRKGFGRSVHPNEISLLQLIELKKEKEREILRKQLFSLSGKNYRDVQSLPPAQGQYRRGSNVSVASNPLVPLYARNMAEDFKLRWHIVHLAAVSGVDQTGDMTSSLDMDGSVGSLNMEVSGGSVTKASRKSQSFYHTHSKLSGIDDSTTATKQEADDSSSILNSSAFPSRKQDQDDDYTTVYSSLNPSSKCDNDSNSQLNIEVLSVKYKDFTAPEMSIIFEDDKRPYENELFQSSVSTVEKSIDDDSSHHMNSDLKSSQFSFVNIDDTTASYQKEDDDTLSDKFSARLSHRNDGFDLEDTKQSPNQSLNPMQQLHKDGIAANIKPRKPNVLSDEDEQHIENELRIFLTQLDTEKIPPNISFNKPIQKPQVKLKTPSVGILLHQDSMNSNFTNLVKSDANSLLLSPHNNSIFESNKTLPSLPSTPLMEPNIHILRPLNLPSRSSTPSLNNISTKSTSSKRPIIYSSEKNIDLKNSITTARMAEYTLPVPNNISLTMNKNVKVNTYISKTT